MATEMLTLNEWADAVGVSHRSAHRWVLADRLPGAVKDERGWWTVPSTTPAVAPGKRGPRRGSRRVPAATPPAPRPAPTMSSSPHSVLDGLRVALGALPGSGYRAVSASWPADERLGGSVTLTLSVGQRIDE